MLCLNTVHQSSNSPPSTVSFNYQTFFPLFYPGQCRGFVDIGVLILCISISQGVTVREVLLVLACTIEKVILWVGLISSMPQSEFSQSETLERSRAHTKNRTRAPDFNS